jgi:hypothetical protein
VPLIRNLQQNQPAAKSVGWFFITAFWFVLLEKHPNSFSEQAGVPRNVATPAILPVTAASFRRRNAIGLLHEIQRQSLFHFGSSFGGGELHGFDLPFVGVGKVA